MLFFYKLLNFNIQKQNLWDNALISLDPLWLKEGFQFVKENGLEVTDDVSVVEHLGKRVQITEGSYYNIKVTTPEDMFIAERLLNEEPKLRCV